MNDLDKGQVNKVLMRYLIWKRSLRISLKIFKELIENFAQKLLNPNIKFIILQRNNKKIFVQYVNIIGIFMIFFLFFSFYAYHSIQKISFISLTLLYNPFLMSNKFKLIIPSLQSLPNKILFYFTLYSQGFTTQLFRSLFFNSYDQLPFRSHKRSTQLGLSFQLRRHNFNNKSRHLPTLPNLTFIPK